MQISTNHTFDIKDMDLATLDTLISALHDFNEGPRANKWSRAAYDDLRAVSDKVFTCTGGRPFHGEGEK